MEDTLKPEYNFTRLKVSSMGTERKSSGKQFVYLEADVAEMFPTAEAVNEALRFLARVMLKESSNAAE